MLSAAACCACCKDDSRLPFNLSDVSKRLASSASKINLLSLQVLALLLLHEQLLAELLNVLTALLL